MTRYITVIGINTDTNVTFKKYAPFTRCIADINDEHIDTAKNLDLDTIMTMYNFIEYRHSYSDTSGSLCNLKEMSPL